MKTIPIALQTHLDGAATTLAWRLKLTATDGTIVALTSHDRDVTIGGTLHAAMPGFDVASFSVASGLAVGNNELKVLEDITVISYLDCLAGKWDGARYEIDQFNTAAPSDGLIHWAYGRLGHVKPGYGCATYELRDLRQALQQDTTAIFQATCRYRLGDARCTVDLGPFTVTGAVTGVASNAQFTDTSRTEVDDWFGYGEVTFTSGLNAGRTFKVRAYASDTFTLDIPAVYAIAIGDEYEAIAGCRKRLEDCRDKFSNILNFGGEPDKPKIDTILNPAPEPVS